MLQHFKNNGGLQVLSEMLDHLRTEFVALANVSQTNNEDTSGVKHVVSTALHIILTFFSHSVNPKSLIEASQTSAMASTRPERDKDKPDYFIPAQFLVELRYDVSLAIERLWNDEKFMETTNSGILKPIIEILRLIFESDAEQGAYRRSDKVPPRTKQQNRAWKLRNPELLSRLTNKGFEENLATEALFRCNESYTMAEEYCTLRRTDPRASGLPPPSGGQMSSTSEDTLSKPQETSISSSILERASMETAQQSQTTTLETSNNDLQGSEAHSGFARALSLLPGEVSGADSSNAKGRPQDIILAKGESSPNNEKQANEDSNVLDIARTDDLDERRASLRENIIDKCLDILGSHADATFDLSDLITSALSKTADPAAMREEISETLIQSLISLQSPDEIPAMGTKVAAYAHLLAILIQDKDFFYASQSELKDNFSALVDFVRWIPNVEQGESPSLWIAKTLLIVERVLAADELPQQIEWNIPQSESQERDDASPIISASPLSISKSDKVHLFENILDLLPHIGKDESLSLSVVRILVILSRDRELALRLGEKKNMQKLFLMVKQLAGLLNERLQGSFLLILRHIVEDENTVRLIMKTEIQAYFESRQSRQIETTSYTRQFYHLILRSPEIFIEVTNEILMIPKFDPNQRPQLLALKNRQGEPASSIKAYNDSEATISKDPSSMEKNENIEVKSDREEAKSQESKPPIIENPDGVMHYLLCELLSYKDVTDKEPSTVEKIKSEGLASKAESPDSNSPPVSSELDVTISTNKKTEEKTFKADQNPIFVYRCFVLHCLTELLACCNRTKLEFISFSRKADPQVKTLTKPHSRVLDYLLNTLIPVGLSESSDDVSLKKRIATSNWAMSVIVSLCAKTGQRISKGNGDDSQNNDSELLFVRKFVLEYALRVFKDSVASAEALDLKYSRLLNLSDLFNRMLVGKPISSKNTLGTESTEKSPDLAKLMIEKSFINVLTTCLGEIDLNFPGSKRTVKYVLRPLRALTKSALEMGAAFNMEPTMAATDNHESISTASSISDYEESREETPDLFRHSTLGMFEPTQDEETDSENEADDDENIVYDDDYADEMDFEDEDMQGGEDVVSEEDEEIEGIGPIEGLPGDVDVQVIIQRDSSSSEEHDPEDDIDDDLDDLDDESPDNVDEDDIEIMDEVTGEDNSALSNDDEWVSEDDGNVDDLENQQGTRSSDSHAQGDVLDHIVRVVENEGAEGLLERLDDAEIDLDIENEEVVDDEMAEDDDGKYEELSWT